MPTNTQHRHTQSQTNRSNDGFESIGQLTIVSDFLGLKLFFFPTKQRYFAYISIVTHIFSWENGENHILFNMVPPESGIETLNTDRAIIAGADFDTWTYRSGFDIVLPFLGYVRDEHLMSLRKRRK